MNTLSPPCQNRPMVEKVLAALTLLLCIGMGIHMALPARWQARLALWARDPLRRKARAQAAAHTQDAIRRASRPPSGAKGRWQGNVYKLDKTKGDDDNDQDQRTLH